MPFVCLFVLYVLMPPGCGLSLPSIKSMFCSDTEQNRTEQNFINLTTSQATRRRRKRRGKNKKKNYMMNKASDKVYK